MHRVSSRQRLVSWDAFDATAQNDSDSEPFWSCAASDELSSDFVPPLGKDDEETVLTHSTSMDSLCRKRKKKSTNSNITEPQSPESWVNATPASYLIPAFASELSYSTSSSRSSRCTLRSSSVKPIAFFTALLPQDAQLHVLGFLGEEDVRHMMAVNHHFRHLLQNSPHVWNCLARQRWPFLAEDVRWTDSLHIPLTVPCVGLEEGVNMDLLLHLAAETKSSCIDESIFNPCPTSRNATRRREQQQRGTLRRSARTIELRTVVLRDGGETAVQFTGRIGFGDRCIRANQPLPHPHALTNKQLRRLSKLRKGRRNLWQRMLRRRDDNSPVWRPFVAPFCLPGGTLSFTPRLISYFEVHILNTQEMSPETPRVEHPHGLQLNRVRALSAECVAVGVSVADFALHSRMPGWDKLSYGYHGDDGGIFHSNGQMIREYGPSFGVGDVVGCGIDYTASSIFYTINGRFLGYAFELPAEELAMDWFPTVGIDTNSLVQCNFGCDRAFRFDLQSMIEKDKAMLVRTVGPHNL